MNNQEIEIMNLNINENENEDIEIVELIDLYQIVNIDKGTVEINIPGLNKIKISIDKIHDLNDEYIDSLNIDEEITIDLKYFINEIKDIIYDKIELYSGFGFSI